MQPSNIHEIFKRLSALNPEPKTELNYSNTYTLLVAVVLSAQATDIGVNKATQSLFKIIHTPKDMIELGEEKLKSHIKTIGLYQSKAKYIMALSKRLIEVYHGQVPTSLEDLQSLPGVGRKTANVVLNCAFGIPTIAVDTHVFRVSNRIGLVHEKTVEATELALLKVIPKTWLQHAHHWLILHGRYICKARKPECYRCEIADLCNYTPKTQE